MFKVRETFIPFCIPDVSEREVDAVAGAIRSGWWAKGPLTVEFEKRFAQYVGAKHAIAVNSCTAALHLALLSQDIGPGDEVITSPLTFASTAMPMDRMIPAIPGRVRVMSKAFKATSIMPV